jgi:hypothetical protein
VRFYLLIVVLATAVPGFAAEARTDLRADSAELGPFHPTLHPTLSQFVTRRAIRDSARIFSGTVLKVERAGPVADGIATTHITFRVEEPIRGVRRGQILKINEWGGLWQAGERYRQGERVLLFLYPASRLGLTSPVGGGRFRVDRAGKVELVPTGMKPIELGSNGGARTAAPTHTTDVRRLAAAIRREASE